jgi:hypothetical protein
LVTTLDHLIAFVERTGAFQESVHRYVSNLVPTEATRHQVAFDSGLISLQHAAAALALVSQEIYPSAFALMRPQYESSLRGFWLTYAASDGWIEKLSVPLTNESARRASKLAMPAEMLEDLAKCCDAPKFIIGQYKSYGEVTWRALSSFTHGGLHPLARLATGYPPQLTYDVLRNSNGVIALTTQLLSNLTGDERNMEPVRDFHREYADCLPVISGPVN